MDLATQIISNDHTVRSNTVQDLKENNSQSLATEDKNGEQLSSMMLSIEKALDLLVDDKVESSTENESSKNKRGSYDKKWLEESKAKLLEQIGDEKRASLIMCRMEKQLKKH